MIPLFPELRPILDGPYELASVGALCVLRGGYRDAVLSQDGWKNCNLRTQFQRILQWARISSWPKPFQNLRASQETELAHAFPLHVVTEWLGNPPQVALKHYRRVTDEDFAQATKPVPDGVAKSGAAGARTTSHRLARNDKRP